MTIVPPDGRRADEPVAELTLRDALGSAAALRLSNTALIMAPSLLLVLLQESHHRFDHDVLVLLSAVLQQLARAILILPVLLLLRGTGWTLPVWVSLPFWASLGASRGIVGGWVAQALSDAPPDYGFRVAFWVFISTLWEPLMLHTLAQLQKRRDALGLLAQEIVVRDEAQRHAERNTQEIRGDLIAAVRGSIGPAVQEIRQSLAAASATIDSTRMRQIGERLAALSAESVRVVEAVRTPTPPHAPTTPRPSTPLVAVLSYQRHQPVLSAVLGGGVLLATVLPLSMNVDMAGAYLPEIVLAVFVSVVANYVLSVLGDRLIRSDRISDRTGVALAGIRYLVAGVLGSVILLLANPEQDDAFIVGLAIVFPLGAFGAAAAVAATAGLPLANADAIAAVALVQAERRALELEAVGEENRVRAQLTELMHGPVQGRLASCAMALNFHSADIAGAPPERTEMITTMVLEHLESASADLHELTAVH